MQQREFPILEYSTQREGVIEPTRIIKRKEIPECAVACFFQDVIKKLVEEHKAEQVAMMQSEIGHNPVYKLDWNGKSLTVFHPGVGAPLAAAFLDEVIALGCSKFVACGGCGVLNSEIAVGHIVVPNAAIRDEGTSYHYLPAEREVEARAEDVAKVVWVLERHGVPYAVGKTWTTDAIYRETAEKVAFRRAEGCLTVEMEAAAFFAVAQFRNVRMAQLLYGGDDLGSEVWDGRDWTRQTSVREKLFWLSAEACLEL